MSLHPPRCAVEHGDTEVRRGSMPNEDLKVRARISAQREVAAGRVIRASPGNEASGLLSLAAQHKPHGWKDGIGWMVEALPYAGAVG